MRTFGIEEFAAWCVQEEWPKVRSRHLDEDEAVRAELIRDLCRLTGTGVAFPRLAEMNWGGVVGGTVRSRLPEGEPHPDAVLFSAACDVLAAVAAAPVCDVEDCLSDQAPLLATGAGEKPAQDWRLAAEHLRQGSVDPRSLVVTYAALARRRRDAGGWDVARPDWHPHPIDRRYQLAETGGHPRLFVTVRRKVRVTRHPEPPAYEVRDFEEEGRDPKTRRPKLGAYRKVEFDPDPGLVAKARHIYAVWWCSMEWLAAWLEASGALSEHVVTGPQGIEKPWQSVRKWVA